MEAKLTILVMSCHWQGALACLQSFGAKGHRVLLVAWSAQDAALHGKSDHVADILYHAPAQRPEGDVAWLLEVIEARGVDLVVPISDHDAALVALAAEQAAPGSRAAGALFAPPAASLALARDRNATAALCERLGIAVPRSQAVEARDLAEVVPGWGYPVFVKHEGQAGIGVHELRDPGDLEALMAKGLDGQVQIQEAIYSDFVDITGVCRAGEVLGHFAFRTDYRFSNVGTPPYALREEREDLVDILERIAGALNWTGGIDLDLLQRPDGSLVVLEINPRLSGTINFALMTGRDIPAGYLALKGGEPGAPPFADTGADLFVSLEQEARLLARATRRDRAQALAFRAGHVRADNGYPQDRGYARALRRRILSVRLDALVDRAVGLGRVLLRPLVAPARKG